MIKKLIGYGMLAVTAMAAPVAMAQDSENLDVWKRNKGINLSYITHQSLKGEMIDPEISEIPIPVQYDSKAGFSLSTGNTYLWPRSAGWAGNRLKVGVDARWFDISYVKYTKYPKLAGIQIEDWMVDPDDFDYDFDYPGYPEDEWDDEAGFDTDNISNQQLHLGVGIGPAVAVVPFPSANSGLRYLRVNLYGHYNPYASALITKDPQGDTSASWAFVNAWDCGMNFQWKYFTLGFEGRWGKAKYNSIISEDDLDVDTDSGDISFNSDTKQTYKNASFRISLGFRF